MMWKGALKEFLNILNMFTFLKKIKKKLNLCLEFYQTAFRLLVLWWRSFYVILFSHLLLLSRFAIFSFLVWLFNWYCINDNDNPSFPTHNFTVYLKFVTDIVQFFNLFFSPCIFFFISPLTPGPCSRVWPSQFEFPSLIWVICKMGLYDLLLILAWALLTF